MIIDFAKYKERCICAIKNQFKNSLLGRWLNEKRRKRLDKLSDELRRPYIPDVKALIGNDTSIICSNCFAGRVMQDIGMEYNTPTLGLYIWAEDYLEFLSNLKYYLTEAKIEFVDHSKYELGNERRRNWSHWYPVGLLGGKVEIQFLHYHSEEEAAEKWYRRAKRINWDKLLVIGFEQNLCTPNHILAFDKLPYKFKLFFSSKNVPNCGSNIYMKEFERDGEAGNPYLKGDLYYKYMIQKLKEMEF